MGACTSDGNIVESVSIAPEEKSEENNSRNVKIEYVSHHPKSTSPNRTSLYKRTHNQLCNRQNLPCFVCDKNDEEDETETHHFFVKRSVSNVIDWIKFGQKAEFLYNPQTGVNIGEEFNWKEVEKDPHIFVDSVHNMVVLCKEHHAGFTGIHNVPFPDWFPQIAPKDGFVFLSGRVMKKSRKSRKRRCSNKKTELPGSVVPQDSKA
jgi:hypothetical protein